LVQLDRILVTRDWENIFPLATVSKLPGEVSDHNPLILSVGIDRPRKKIEFKFELSWLKHQEFIPKVKEILEKPCRAVSALDRIQQKLKMFKQHFKGRGFNLQGEWRKKGRKSRKNYFRLSRRRR
jgi:hypothetical protein